MATTDTAINTNLKKHVADTNAGMQKLQSVKAIPLWINPNNGNFYTSNPYKAGDVVILLSDIEKIYSRLRYYFESIAKSIGLDVMFFIEKNNPELDNNQVLDVLLYGGYIPGTDNQYINPITIVSNSNKGYGLYVSLKNQNYDMPGVSDSWFNLDMSESLESVQLQLARVISILTTDKFIDNLYGTCINPDTKEEYGKDSKTYLQNRLEMHQDLYHFKDGLINSQVEEANDELNRIQAEIESHVNTTTSVMRNPFIVNGEIVGNTLTVIQTTGQMFFYCMLDTTKFEKDTDITIQFTPTAVSNIMVPFVLRTNNGILTVSNPKKDKYVKIEGNKCAWYVDSFVTISNDANAVNNIIIETADGFTEANFNNNFRGFIDDSYIVTYTPIGSEVRTENIAIHCSPVREIERTNTTFTFQLSSEYAWQHNAIAIAISGKCEVDA